MYASTVGGGAMTLVFKPEPAAPPAAKGPITGRSAPAKKKARPRRKVGNPA